MASARQQARTAGLRYYETGRPCTNGHVSPRFVSNGSCLECAADESRRFASAHPYDPAKARGYYLKYNHRPERPCKHCGATMPAGSHNNRDYCSRACKYAVDVAIAKANHITRCKTDARYREMFLRNGHIRRARKNGVGFVRFDPLSVLERDGWTCKVCGVDTPKELRGQRVWNAPTLDHVVPLARGGHHAPDNTRCACLRCNTKLGARVRKVA